MSYRRLRLPSERTPYPVYQITNLSDLVRFVRNHTEEGETYIFRGQKEDWPVLPSMSRIVVDEGQELEVEQRMLTQFSRLAVNYDVAFPTDKWEALAVAQHHGVPTRLIDWTYNAIVAAWFAVMEPATSNRRCGVIWMYTPDLEQVISDEERSTSPFDIKEMRVFVPRHVNPRIRAQDGLFTISPYQKNKGFRPLERFGSHRECMKKIEIPASKFYGLRYDLISIGVHAGSVFPGLDGLAKEILDANCYKSDEIF